MRSVTKKIDHQRGFTLAEMAVVVVIAGILMVSGVKILTAQMDSASYSVAREKQEMIKQALITYLGINRRLPCPDTRSGNGPGALLFTVAAPPDGIENLATAGNAATNCAASFGVIPYATLGLAREVAVDGWGNLFSYHLSTAPSNWGLTASFADINSGALIINERTAAGAVSLLTSTVVVVIVSHGKNGNGAWTVKGTQGVLPAAATNPDERENTNIVNNTTYFKREYSDNVSVSGGSFDDLVMFITAADLISPLRRDGTLQNMNAMVMQQQESIKNSIVGFMMGAGCSPPANITTALGLSVGDVTDPWGSLISFPGAGSVTTLTASNANLVPLGTAASPAFTLTSLGPNRALGGGDDIVLTQTVGQMRGLLGGAYATRCP